MKKDPIVREVRKAREEIFAPFSNDPAGFFNYLKSCEKKYKNRLIARQPQPALRRKIA